jgi:hypothetical protein
MTNESEEQSLKHPEGSKVTRGGTVNDLSEKQQEKHWRPIS